MITNEAVALWLSNYVEAWKSYSPDAIRALFTEDARYYYGPFDQPLQGREAIVADWLKDRDKAGTYTGDYRMVASNSNLVVTNGRSTYYQDDGKTVRSVFDNIFILEFDDTGRCSLFKEWFIPKPGSKD